MKSIRSGRLKSKIPSRLSALQPYNRHFPLILTISIIFIPAFVLAFIFQHSSLPALPSHLPLQTSVPALAPSAIRPTPQQLANGSIRIVTTQPLSLAFTLPPKVKYTFSSSSTHDDFGVNLTLPSGTTATFCEGCQLFTKGCDDPSGSILCSERAVTIGSMPANEVYFIASPQKIAAYKSNLASMIGTRPIYFQIYPLHNAELSNDDKNILGSIFTTMIDLQKSSR